MKRQSLNIETRDIERSDAARSELLAGSGDLMVPCLQIEDSEGGVSWIYESKVIIGYLEGRLVAG